MKAEKDIRKIASIVLTPDELLNLMSIIKRWRKKIPRPPIFPLIRFSNFAGERRESTLTRAETPEGLYSNPLRAPPSSGGNAFAGRAGHVFGDTHAAIVGHVQELWLTNMLNNPDMKKILTDLSQLSQGTAGSGSDRRKAPGSNRNGNNDH